MDRWSYIWDRIRHAVMLRYETPGHSNGVPILKTHIQKWEINIGHLGGYNIWEKGSGALFSQKRPNDIGNLCWSGPPTTSGSFLWGMLEGDWGKWYIWTIVLRIIRLNTQKSFVLRWDFYVWFGRHNHQTLTPSKTSGVSSEYGLAVIITKFTR